MLYKKIAVLCLILALFPLCSCSKELSRSKAQSLLNESEAFKSWKPEVTLRSQQFAKPACGKFVSMCSGCENLGSVLPSAKGKQYFANFAGNADSIMYQNGMCNLKVPGSCWFGVLLSKQVGEVTGITASGESERNVDFKLQYEYPEEVLNCTGKFPEAAKATFRMYDNGWRLMKVGY
jgi:hypothetical protein